MQTSITPVQVYPATANTLYIRSIGLGPPPSYYYELQDVQVVAGTPAVGVEGVIVDKAKTTDRDLKEYMREILGYVTDAERQAATESGSQDS